MSIVNVEGINSFLVLISRLHTDSISIHTEFCWDIFAKAKRFFFGRTLQCLPAPLSVHAIKFKRAPCYIQTPHMQHHHGNMLEYTSHLCPSLVTPLSFGNSSYVCNASIPHFFCKLSLYALHTEEDKTKII